MTQGFKTVEYAAGRGFLSSTDEIVEDMRNGRMVILVDAEDRENEGDLVIPAQMATPDAVNFMARYGRGLICLTLTRERGKHRECALEHLHVPAHLLLDRAEAAHAKRRRDLLAEFRLLTGERVNRDFQITRDHHLHAVAV